ncbi:MAG TPA: helix-turn-helix transcriptional regulator [Spirochaetota bacterium]|nr:helix-turn-helix transcriptional regulator [Spirochaetota bacterium]HPF06436.1 helix-turn-helix transcriptional regulator [Spirochaetota bacterium]HPJ42869.1 helix-turn-helix transcriptional regulator [Spirochaetota bacterium]HPR37540.1 helix-turn-helix transcriptional regulator [Spirochaetota bacterium]HRX47622.1 helix-turn-helix transcriptional regulator [Spirochaetota bacterium]
MSGSERLKLFLKTMGKTQQQFAQDVGLTQAAISDIIRGKTPSVSDSVARLCMYLYNANPRWLLTGEGEMFLSAIPNIAESGDQFEISNKEYRGAEPLAGVTDFEQITRTGWYRQLSATKREIIAALCEVKDAEILDNISEIITSQAAREKAEEKLLQRLKELEKTSL